MEITNSPKLKTCSLLFLCPGLVGLVVSAALSMLYRNTLPRSPDPVSFRMFPRSIDGYTVYQTEEEEQRLDWAEYSSAGLLIIGAAWGLVYLEKCGIARAVQSDQDEFAGEEG